MSILDFDYQVFEFINHLGVALPLLNPVMRFFSEYAEYLFYVGVIVYWFMRMQKIRQMVAEALLSAVIAFGFGGIISYFFYRDRPFVHHAVIQLIQHPANASFPSDHAMGAFVIATAIWLFRKRDGAIWLTCAGLIAISRVWTGVHYPLDVIAGALVGIISALLIHQMFARLLSAQKILNVLIGIYEEIEQKVWSKQPSN